jgi:hypothetical protein
MQNSKNYPVRGPKRGIRGKNIGKFFSVKMNSMLWFESLLEESLMYLLDFDPSVKRFKEQPCHIRYMHEGKRHRYTPDFFVERPSERQIIEVKPKSKAATEKYRLLFRIVSHICEREGYKFKVYTEETILLQPRLNSVKALWSYARTPFRLQHQLYCQEFLQRKQTAYLAEVFEYFKSKGASKQIVYALLYWGVLDFDLMEPLSLSSRIYLPSSAVATVRMVNHD